MSILLMVNSRVSPSQCRTARSAYAHLYLLYYLPKDIQVQLELISWLLGLLEAPLTKTGSVPGHDQIYAVLVNAIVMQLTHPWQVLQPLHDANLCEGSHLHQDHELSMTARQTLFRQMLFWVTPLR